jgi:hypothetical protein
MEKCDKIRSRKTGKLSLRLVGELPDRCSSWTFASYLGTASRPLNSKRGEWGYSTQEIYNSRTEKNMQDCYSYGHRGAQNGEGQEGMLHSTL